MSSFSHTLVKIAWISVLIGVMLWLFPLFHNSASTWSSLYWSQTGAFIYTGGIQSQLPKNSEVFRDHNAFSKVETLHNAVDTASGNTAFLYYLEYPVFSDSNNTHIAQWLQGMLRNESAQYTKDHASVASLRLPELHGSFSVVSSEHAGAVIYTLSRTFPDRDILTEIKVFPFGKHGNILRLDDLWRWDDQKMRSEAMAHIEKVFSEKTGIESFFGGEDAKRYDRFVRDVQFAFSGTEVRFWAHHETTGPEKIHEIWIPYDHLRWHLAPVPRLPENPPPLQIVPNTSIDGGKYVALTFDDGPNNTTTPRLLDMLKSSHVPATFYVLGSQVERFPEVAKRIVHEGHEIGNHSWSHPQLTKLDRDAVWKQIDATNQVIFDTTGVYPKWLRPPYGSYNTITRQIAREMPIIMWSVDSYDWKYRNVQKNLRVTMDSMHEGAIILYHDIHQSSIDTIPPLIEALRAQGYQMVTVSELYKKYPTLLLEWGSICHSASKCRPAYGQ